MRRKTVVVLFLLAALLTAPWASAAPRHGGGRPATVSGGMVIPDVLAQAWSFLKGVWGKTGCNIDPDGRCVTTTAPTFDSPGSGYSGCQIDPNGKCHAEVSTVISAETGCQIDPFGRCGS
jgi:hypothetical protein